jgi:hypothetical protein
MTESCSTDRACDILEELRSAPGSDHTREYIHCDIIEADQETESIPQIQKNVLVIISDSLLCDAVNSFHTLESLTFENRNTVQIEESTDPEKNRSIRGIE